MNVSANSTEWSHKDVWHRSGKDFLVEIKRHREQGNIVLFTDGRQRWCVYAYIYPKHPLFGSFDGKDMWQPAPENLPLHGGCSFLKIHRDDAGNITSVQVGADYNHLHDGDFTFKQTAEDAELVFLDADKLFDHLNRANP